MKLPNYLWNCNKFGRYNPMFRIFLEVKLIICLFVISTPTSDNSPILLYTVCFGPVILHFKSATFQNGLFINSSYTSNDTSKTKPFESFVF